MMPPARHCRHTGTRPVRRTRAAPCSRRGADMADRPISTQRPATRGHVDAPVPNPEAKVYVISVAAELAGMHPQKLRGYDRIGLVRPARSDGGGRRYSWRDIQRLREVSRLTNLGIGL